MKFNKWTLGLAGIGAISMASAVRADEAKMSMVNTALSNTTLSGYVDTAVQYTAGNQSGNNNLANAPAGTGPGTGTGVGKIDNFSLNDVDIALDHPVDSTPWAAGYHIDLNTGSDAVGFGGIGGVAGLRQAYVALVTPVGSGITWKMGIQDDIIGYEGNTDGANPNYSRSYGYFVEPTTLLGLVGSYQITSAVGVQAGIANATSGVTSSGSALTAKSYVAAVTLTAPDSWGFLKGGTGVAGVVINPEKQGQDNYYFGVTIPTPCNKLKVGGALDFVTDANKGLGNPESDSGYTIGAYANFQATDKLSFNARAEYFSLDVASTAPYNGGTTDNKGEEFTATVQYNLWANVISRAEFRWDHADTGNAFSGFDKTRYGNNFLLALNVIYTF